MQISMSASAMKCHRCDNNSKFKLTSRVRANFMWLGIERANMQYCRNHGYIEVEKICQVVVLVFVLAQPTMRTNCR